MAARRDISERGQLDLFRALPGDFAPRDAQDLMAYPFFSLSKSRRIAPIDFAAGNVTIRVEAVPDHGMATIWDADILIWAASQIVEARDAGLRTSRLMAATPYEILNYVGRGTSLRDYQRLKAALDRLQSTTVSTSIRQPVEGRRHRFSWINEWQERTNRQGTRIIGEYSNDVGYGQRRILLVWSRLIFPNGRSIVLERQPGADPLGHAGLEDRVDYHWWDLAKAAGLSTLLSVGAELAVDDDDRLLRAIRNGGQDTINDAGQQIIRRQLQVAPTLTIRPGFPVRVVVTRDLILEPYGG